MARRAAPLDPRSLRASIERALDREDHPGAVVVMLERLQQIAQEGTDDRRFAERRLAELLLERDPWRAAALIRGLLQHDDSDAANWALMGLAQALLGHHRFATRSYRQALARDPGNPWYSHNLGHLLDVALDSPADARPYLRRAHAALPDADAITCSLVHALWRAGDLDEAKRILAPLLVRGGRHDPDVIALAAEIGRDEAIVARVGKRTPGKRGVLDGLRGRAVRDALDAAAGQVAWLPHVAARARRVIEDYERLAEARGRTALGDVAKVQIAVGAALLAIAHVDDDDRASVAGVSAAVGAAPRSVETRLRALIRALGIETDDPRYRRRQTFR